MRARTGPGRVDGPLANARIQPPTEAVVRPTTGQTVPLAQAPEAGASTASRPGPTVVLAARKTPHRSAGRVVGTELMREGQVRAARHGVTVLSSNPRDVLDRVLNLTGGRGDERVINAVTIGCAP